MQFGLLANLDNRRADFFRQAVTKARLPPPREVAWSELLADPGVLSRLDGCGLVRIDSWGEHAQVHDALIQRGGAPPGTCLAFGELAYLKEAHVGFCQLLETLGAHSWLSEPHDVAVMFDKWESHRRFARAGLPRPPTRLLPSTLEAFYRLLPNSGRWFLKPLHGSSASGVCALRWHGERMQLTAPIEISRTGSSVRLFNTLRVRRYARQEAIETVLRALLPAGMIAEDWLPKARIDGVEFDLRIVVVAGEARHVVVRTSRHPMTNLHLGNARGSLAAVEREHGAGLALCRRVAEDAMAIFPHTLYGGVDAMLDRAGRPWLLEVNAFGDLLPGILDRGENTYEASVNAALRMRP